MRYEIIMLLSWLVQEGYAEIMKTPLYIFNYRGGHCRGAVGTCTE